MIDLFKRVSKQINLYNSPKYVFKKGDLVQELIPEEFPEIEGDQAHLVIVDARWNVENMTIKKHDENTLKCTYHFSKTHNLEFAIFKKDGETQYQYHLNPKLAMALAKKGIKADALVSQQVNRISVMLGMLKNDYAHYYEMEKEFYSIGRNLGRLTLVGSKNKLAKKINNAYPYFHDVELFSK